MPKLLAATLIFTLGLAPPVGADSKSSPGWIGISFEGVDGLKISKVNPRGLGVRVTSLWEESPGQQAGLRQRDVILSVDGKPFDGPLKQLATQFSARIKNRRAGDKLTLLVYRQESQFRVTPPDQKDPILKAPRDWLSKQKDGATLEVRGSRIGKTLTVTVQLVRRPAQRWNRTSRTNAQLEAAALYPLANHRVTDHERFNRQLVDASGTRKAYDDLLSRLKRVEAGNDGFRLEAMRYVHRDPFRLRAVTKTLVGDLRQKTGFVSSAVWRSAFGLLTGKRQTELPPPKDSTERLTPDQLLSRIEGTLQHAAGLVDRALSGIPLADRTFLAQNLSAVVEAFDQGIYLYTDKNKLRRKKVLGILRLAPRLNYQALQQALDSLDWLYRPGHLAAVLARVTWPAGSLEKQIVAQRQTRWGPILIGGSGRNWYRNQDAAVIIDLGGDDFYTNNTAASVPGKIPVSIIVDLSGNDAYESHRRYTQGCGVLGIGILVDRAGDDNYVGTSFTQGCGYLGVGLLIDEAGSDTYRGLKLHQGVGLWGVGALIDKGGDDRYQAQLYSQGVGLSHGIGVLYDLSGNDRYYAKGQRPTGYGTPGVFDAWSQGCGLGFRSDASGGIGILLDGAGRDRYEGGNFSQGGGYYYAWGILYDAGQANDVYVASRYGQGWSAHQAVGTFIEEGGDDLYSTRHAVNSGLAWDQCVTLFLEQGGNDTYQGGGFSQGASAHNSICLFYDLGGRDRYRGVVPARAGTNSYHGGTSWSLFIDAGGDADTYQTQDPLKRLANNVIFSGKEHFTFCDLPARLSDALQGQGWRKLRQK